MRLTTIAMKKKENAEFWDCLFIHFHHLSKYSNQITVHTMPTQL